MDGIGEVGNTEHMNERILSTFYGVEQDERGQYSTVQWLVGVLLTLLVIFLIYKVAVMALGE